MSHFRDRPFLRLCPDGRVCRRRSALAACGRKGPLDPPPGARRSLAISQAGYSRPVADASPVSSPIGGQSKRRQHGYRHRNGRAVAPKGEKKHIPLDALLN